MSDYEDVYPTGVVNTHTGEPVTTNREQAQAEILKDIKDSVRAQGYKLKEANDLLDTAHQLFKDIAMCKMQFRAEVQAEGKRVTLKYANTKESAIVCTVARSHEIGYVYVGDGTKCDDFHGSTFRCTNARQMLDQIKDYVLRFCGAQGIQSL